jgi:hypothetical protein
MMGGMAVYRMEVRCGGEPPQPHVAYTDDEGLASVRAGDLICGCCFDYYELVSARSATEEEIAANPLR